MQALNPTHPTLVANFIKGESPIWGRFALVLAGVAALWISAKVEVPFYPVPMTMQTFVIFLIGMTYGWKLGAETVVVYLAAGALGAPVFAGTPEKGIGIAYMAGPTGGYLLGFVFAAALVGWLAQRGWDRSIIKTFIAITMGTAIIYFFGLLWLGTVIGWDKPVLAYGLMPFLTADLLKSILASAMLPLMWKIFR